jgi:hypothetical protein
VQAVHRLHELQTWATFAELEYLPQKSQLFDPRAHELQTRATFAELEYFPQKSQLFEPRAHELQTRATLAELEYLPQKSQLLSPRSHSLAGDGATTASPTINAANAEITVASRMVKPSCVKVENTPKAGMSRKD